MSRRESALQNIPAIPTTYRGVRYRSRLEARWASFFDALGWRVDYEPDLQAGLVIPDFLLVDFAHPVLVECKPAVTVDELADERAKLIARMPNWLKRDIERELRVLELDDLAPLELTDRALDDLVRVDCGQNPRGYSRRILVVGPSLHLVGDAVTVDGRHGLCECRDAHGGHTGLVTELGAPCLRCGCDVEAWSLAADVFPAWRAAQNAAHWKPA